MMTFLLLLVLVFYIVGFVVVWILCDASFVSIFISSRKGKFHYYMTRLKFVLPKALLSWLYIIIGLYKEYKRIQRDARYIQDMEDANTLDQDY